MKYTENEKIIVNSIKDEVDSNKFSIKDLKKEIFTLQQEKKACEKFIMKHNGFSVKEKLKLNREKIRNFLELNDVKATNVNIEKFLSGQPVIDDFNKNEWNYKTKINTGCGLIHIKFIVNSIKVGDLFHEDKENYFYLSKYDIRAETFCVRTDGARVESILDFSKDLQKKGFSEKEIKKFEGKIFKKILSDYNITKSTKIPQRYKKYFLLLG